MSDISLPDTASIVAEYEESAQRSEDYQKVKWASSVAMYSRFALAMEHLPFGLSRSWLDIGCGPGSFQALLAGRFPQLQCTGMDLSPSLILDARRRMETSACRFLLGDAMELSGATFDLITCIGVLQRTSFSSRRFFEKVSELLTPNGRLFLDTKNRTWRGFTSGNLTPDPHLQWFDPALLRQQAEENGLTVLAECGFDPHAGVSVPLEEAHTFYLVAVRQ